MTSSNITTGVRLPALSDSIQYIKGVGPKRALLLEKCGIKSVEDCFYFLPFRYEDWSQVKSISRLTPGKNAAVVARITRLGAFKSFRRRRKIFEMTLQDDTGLLHGVWFQANESYMKKKFQIGDQVIVSGKVEVNHKGSTRLQMVHPDIDPYSDMGEDMLELGRLIPFYHSTEGLHQKTLRAIIRHVIESYGSLIKEWLPEEILKRHSFSERATAFGQIHSPSKNANLNEYQQFKSAPQRRLIFEEFFMIQLALAYKRRHQMQQEKSFSLKTRGQTIHKFVQRMKFDLTGAQKKVLGEIMKDLERKTPMNRLIQGDVGSGKTIVAFITLLTSVDNGFQGALMVPTELLAEQHFLNMEKECKALGISLELITSAANTDQRRNILKNIREGKTQIVVGTHALIQKDVQFKNLGVAVIDEQHRFGVLQREALTRKGLYPHTLIMTATPIPRSLALTLYGDLDVSLIDEMPSGRQPIHTRIYYEASREKAYDAAQHQIQQGRQAYVVCPLIEETETLDLKTATEVQGYLQSSFPDLVVGLIHGKIKKETRGEIMSNFKAGNIHILVATTVIEVGIDIPNATLMIVEHAERFGLSQLHQLRGRVGRGAHPSHCLLITYPPVSDDGKARLKIMESTGDGFKVAEEDLNIRGPGDFMGTRQSGMPALKIAHLIRDIKILDLARKEAFNLINQDPDLAQPENASLKKEFLNIMGSRMDLMDII